MRQIESNVLSLAVNGLNLSSGTLGGQFTAPATLLVFLRHLGCMFCREMVRDLRAAIAAGPFPPVVLVTQSPEDASRIYFTEAWPDVPVITDPARTLYTAFGVARAGFGGLFGPAVWNCSMRAMAKGNRQQISRTLRPDHGDPWLLSAMFLVAPGGNVLWSHRAQYAGERPEYAEIASAARPERQIRS